MSLSAKTEKWLARECDITLAGKTVAVTGANSGVGFKIAETALYLGAKVVLACRNAEKAESAREKLLADCPGADIRVLQLDLADLSSVDSFAETVVKEAIDIDVFVNNAGVIKRPGDKTADGLDLVIGTNYIGV